MYSEIILDGLLLHHPIFWKKTRAILVAYGVNSNGSKKLIHYMLPSHENERDWKLFLADLKKTGIKESDIKCITSDGMNGLKNAVSEIYPNTSHHISDSILIHPLSVWLKVYVSSKNPKKLRLFIAWPLALLYLWLFKATPTSLAIGILFIILGELIRLWAAGTIIKTKELTISGPYAFTRNPLYIGSFSIGVGFLILGQTYWLFIPLLLLFFLIYQDTVQKEEESLKEHFGNPFLYYMSHVPKFIPHLTPFRDSHFQSWPFSLKRCYDNGELRTLAVISFALAGLLYFLF